MKRYNFPKGKMGEEVAARYLRDKGYRVIEKNYRTRFGEIDLVVTKNNILVFVEVKSKIGEDYGTPEEMIDKRKLLKVQRTAQSYLLSNPKVSKKFSKLRIDAVAIVLDHNKMVNRINHYKNIGLDFI